MDATVVRICVRSDVGDLFTIDVVLLEPSTCVNVLNSDGIKCWRVFEWTVVVFPDCEVTSYEGSDRVVCIPSDRRL